MDIADAYLPWDVFAPAGEPGGRPRVFISPQRYVQGEGVLAHIGRYLSLVKARHVAVLISQRGLGSDGAVIMESLRGAGVGVQVCVFGGECSNAEVARHVAALGAGTVDCVVAVGGGKCVDAGKAIAFRLDVPVAVVPTLASNDAPCSALSVFYTPEGISAGAEFYPASPALVVVDTAVVAAASERYLVAGMGDAMATWYEARVCMENPDAVTMIGARPTLASCAIGEACAHALFADGVAAARAVRGDIVDAALEKVVEANTLLSGLGFESGGVAAAHALAQSYTGIAAVRDGYLHGEMVAMGTLAQLIMEGRADEAERVATFFAQVGLPVHLGQLSFDPENAQDFETLIEGVLGFPFIGNMPMPVDAAVIRRAVLGAHAVGLRVAGVVGDTAYRRLHTG